MSCGCITMPTRSPSASSATRSKAAGVSWWAYQRFMKQHEKVIEEERLIRVVNELWQRFDDLVFRVINVLQPMQQKVIHRRDIFRVPLGALLVLCCWLGLKTWQGRSRFPLRRELKCRIRRWP